MRTQEIKLDKVQRSCTTARKVLTVIIFLLAVTALLCVIGGITCFVLNDKITEAVLSGSGTLTLSDIDTRGIIHLYMNMQDFANAFGYGAACGSMCIFGLVVTLASLWIFYTIRNIFSIITENNTPFSEIVIQKLRKIFIALTIVAGLALGLGCAVMLGLFLWCIYCIFDYGSALQTEVDETV